jgi:hypothetical protein
MILWIEANGVTVDGLASKANCSAAHLRNIFAGRKDASLGLAKRLNEISGNAVPMDAFLRPEPVGVPT